MKIKNLVLGLAICGALFTGCATYNKGLDAARTTGEALPAIVDDTKTLSAKIEALYNKVVGLFSTEPEPVPAPAPAK